MYMVWLLVVVVCCCCCAFSYPSSTYDHYCSASSSPSPACFCYSCCFCCWWAVELAAASVLFEFYAVGWRIGAGVYNKAAREENVKKRDLLQAWQVVTHDSVQMSLLLSGACRPSCRLGSGTCPHPIADASTARAQFGKLHAQTECKDSNPVGRRILTLDIRRHLCSISRRPFSEAQGRGTTCELPESRIVLARSRGNKTCRNI